MNVQKDLMSAPEPATAEQVWEAISKAERLAFSYAGSLDLGEDREFAFDVHERLRTATRK